MANVWRGPYDRRRLWTAILVLAVALLLLLLVFPSWRWSLSPSLPRLVVLYVPCSVSHAHLSPYNHTARYTPHIQRFADEGIVFTKHNTESGQSGPAYASIFTGSQAYHHGIYSHPTRLEDAAYLVAEAFRDSGYETHLWDGHPMASAALNFGQGVSDENISSGGERVEITANDERFDSLLERLSEEADLRVFVQVNFTVTHSPYHAVATTARRKRFCELFPEECMGVDESTFDRFLGLYEENRFQLEGNFTETSARLGLSEKDVQNMAGMLEILYRTSVYELDRYFGMFVERIRGARLIDESLIVLTADHGEILFRPNAIYKWSHGYQLAPEVLTVPWIVRQPRAAGGGHRYRGVTRSIDVFPTLAGLAGIELAAGTEIEGRDLTPVLRGVEPVPDLEAFSHTTVVHPVHLERWKDLTLWHQLIPRSDPELMWVRSRRGDTVHKWRLFLDGQWRMQVFDLGTDPEEHHDLYDSHDPQQAAALGRLLSYKRRLVQGYGSDRELFKSREDTLDRLRSLGYIE